MNAHPNEQRMLLQLREFDTRLMQLAHQARTLPHDAQIAELDAADSAAARERLEAHSALEAVRTELARIETDVELVQARIARDVERESSTQSAKDLSAIEHEMESLRERLALLEDAELSVMERIEAAEAEVALIEGRATERADARASVTADRNEQLAALEREREGTASDRRALASTIAPELLATYEQRRERTGTGAGLLRQKTCGACSLVLTGSDVERIRQVAADVLVFCPECDAILVRTEESGL